jgi:transcriptional regulator with PAS, ATPase and Fis domain
MSRLESVTIHQRFGGIAESANEGRTTSCMIGESGAWRAVIDTAARLAPLETTACLQGESGTGKEVLARFLHRNSPRRSGPFLAINCAALPEHLFESELFGFERGAFTGAQQPKAGQLELAAGGVLFLDEISELTPAAQAKILRVLQEREFRRLGGTRSITVDVRVIVATNQDLRQAVARGAFRADLYYRVNVFEIRVPPLRHRGEDIIPLARRFLYEFSRTNNAPVTALAPDAVAALIAYPWPGNVRELQNVIERAAIVCDAGVIHESDLVLAQADTVAEDRTRLSDLEQRAIAHAMREVNGNRSKAARQLGISRTQLYARLRKYGLESAGR